MPVKPALSEKYIKEVKYLYYNKGYSAREIADKIGVSLDAVFSFMRRHSLERRSFEESNRIRFKRKALSYRLKKGLTRREKQLKTAGVMLYWAEGSKSNPSKRSWTVDFANSNPEMIKLFLRFLRIICGVDEKRIRIYLYAYADQDIETLKRYWQKITDISLKQFTKPYIRQDFLPEKSGKMKHGLVHVRYADKKLLLQIEEWIKKYLDNNL